MTVQLGDWISDRFEVFEIHQGGMGVVYLARDHRGAGDRDTVALKTLRDELLVDRERSERFALECRIWVQLGRHPHIVRAHGVETIDGKPHIILERVDGGELGRRIGRDPFDFRSLIRFGGEFCLGMSHAIRQGLRCHRDIKPGNLLLTRKGTLKISDFGLANIRDELMGEGLDGTDDPILIDQDHPPPPITFDDPRDRIAPPRPLGDASTVEANRDRDRPRREQPDSTHVDPSRPAVADETIDWRPPPRSNRWGMTIDRLTRSGALLGTLPYMAPEQFKDPGSVDVRADIYAFGVVLYELLTGERPFKGNTVAMLSRQHAMYLPPSIVSVVPRKFARAAPFMDAIVHRCLAKDPADRYETIDTLHDALHKLWGLTPR